MLERIQLDERYPTPLYRQLSEQIASMIRRGVLPNGERIPPTRELASQLGLNRTTVSAAYGVLESEGLIRGHVGRGSFVDYQGPVSQAPADAGGISFASSRPAPEQFPLGDFQECCREVVSGPEAASVLELGSPAGYPPLRRYLLETARETGMVRPGDEVLVTSGCQQGLDLLQRVLAPAGSTVAVEDPVYHGIRKVFDRPGMRLLGVPMTDGGIDIDRLASVCAAERPKLLIVTPDFQNPTGASLSVEDRLAVIRLAHEFRVVLVEHSLYRDVRYQGDDVPTLKQLDETGSVVQLCSFSKVAFPGLRVGWVVGPARMVVDMTEERQWCDLHTDHLSQAILLRFAESGRLQRHILGVRKAGRERLHALLSACERHMPESSEWTRPQGGFNLWLRLPPGLDTVELLPAAERDGVTYMPGRHFCVNRRDDTALRLSFGTLTPGRIESGMAILGSLFRKCVERPSGSSRFEAAPAVV